jgi:hypothetical protein
MRAKPVNFKRGEDPLDSLNVGRVKQRAIKKAIEDLAKKNHEDPEVYDESPESFSMGFEYRGVAAYFIEVNDSYDSEYIAGYQDLKIPADERQECDTIEQAVKLIDNWVDYIDENWDPSGECPNCGEMLDDVEEPCPYCDNENDD